MSDYEPLVFSEEELSDIRTLRDLAKRKGYEYGIIHSKIQKSSFFTDGLTNKVYVNLAKYPEGNIKIFHCHTNEMPLSIQDMSFLCNDLVDDVVVVTIWGEVFHVSVGTGERVSYDEYCERVSVVAADADTSILDNEDFWDWDEPRRNYEVCKETMVRIALEFKWSLKGGTVDEL